MQTIRLRDHLSEIKVLIDLPAQSRARRKAFLSLRKSLTDRDIVRESRFWTWVALPSALAVFARMALYGVQAEHLPEGVAWTWLGVLCVLGGICLYAQRRINLGASQSVQALVDAVAPRLTALPPTVYETLSSLLLQYPEYLFAEPVRSSTVCGCIRCNERFPARDISWSEPPLPTPHCPRCGADEEYLIFSSGSVNVTKENLALLRNLFDEEN